MVIVTPLICGKLIVAIGKCQRTREKFDNSIRIVNTIIQTFYFSHWKLEEFSLTQTLGYKRIVSLVLYQFLVKYHKLI